LRAWQASPVLPARRALLVPQHRKESSAAPEELVWQQQDMELREAKEEWVDPEHQPGRSRRKIRRRQPQEAKEPYCAISWTNPPCYIDEQDLHRFDKFTIKARKHGSL
jgi:hypothetical protein